MTQTVREQHPNPNTPPGRWFRRQEPSRLRELRVVARPGELWAVSAIVHLDELKALGLPDDPHRFPRPDGRLLKVDEYAALFSIVGYRYGTDGPGSFALPTLMPKQVD